MRLAIPAGVPTPSTAGTQSGQRNHMHLNAMLLYLREQIFAHGGGNEHLHAIFLDADRGFLADRRIVSGNGTALALRMRALFTMALQIGSRSLIVAHNHPSGDCRPSVHDIAATRRMAAIAAALDIELLDHIIITPDRAYSMRAGGDL
ncbi:MAG: hypothetical protein APF82_08310 [Sphingomonadales bacterium BRH_c42]|nr:MAG: hypothetical protein APF82_08310 [Sphingomonadales bacterium BRH_c42]